MKLLHLADLHIGKRVKEFSMIDEQRYIFDEIANIIEEERTDGVMIAGDVYDKGIPSTEAVLLFDEFLRKLVSLSQEVFVISGNHDSAERLSFASSLIDESGVHFSKAFTGEITPYAFERKGVKANIYCLPFVRPVNVRQAYQTEEIKSYAQAVSACIDRVQLNNREINILVTHQFVTGARQSGSEEMSVGGIEEVPASVFEAFDYTALGHIHSRQSFLGGKVRYCGTPLKYSDAETDDDKRVTIVEITDKQTIAYREIPLIPQRDMRRVKGLFADFMHGESDDYLFFTLTDENEVTDAVRSLRTRYPNLMSLKYDNSRTRRINEESKGERVDGETPFELFDEFYYKQNGERMSQEQAEYIENIMKEIWGEEK